MVGIDQMFRPRDLVVREVIWEVGIWVDTEEAVEGLAQDKEVLGLVEGKEVGLMQILRRLDRGVVIMVGREVRNREDR
jgi:hypothetical protein